MLTPDQKVLIYRDAIIISLDNRDSVGAQIFSRVAEGGYGLESRNIEEVSAFYLEEHFRINKAVEKVRDMIQDEVQDFKYDLDLEEEDENQ